MTEHYGTEAAKALWQAQELELPRLSPEFLRLRANDVRRTERAEALWGYAAFVALSAWVVWMFATLPVAAILEPAVWLPRLIAMLLYAGAIFSAVRWHRVRGHRVITASPSESSGLQTYCFELERLRESRRISWNFSYYLPGFAAWVAGRFLYDLWPHGTLMFVFVAATFAVTFVWAFLYTDREDKRLRNEIRELKALKV